MAKDNDPWRRLREREDEKETEKHGPHSQSGHVAATDDSGKLHEMLQTAEPLIEQLNNLYNQYFAGAEKRPPIEKRTQLDRMIEAIFNSPKPTPSLRFRCSAVHARFITHRDRWDKRMKDLEAGPRRRG